MASTLRPSDTAVETELARFLDRNFYPRYVANFHRFTDRHSQFSGLDVRFDLGEHRGLLVDEKAQAHYINKPLPTFAFEVNFINAAGELNEGWLFDETKQAQCYALMWIKAKKDKGIVAADITEVEMLLVERNKILGMLAAQGCDKPGAMATAANIRQGGVPGKHGSGNVPFYYFFTTTLSERPINIVIRKNELQRIAIARFVITP